MKICLCANRFPPNVVGGAEVVVHDLAVQLQDRGHEVSILTLSDTRSGRKTIVGDLDVYVMPNVNIYNQFAPDQRNGMIKALFGVIDTFNPLVLLLTWRQLKSLGADVLCTNNIKGIGPAVWLAARMLRVPVVHVMHDYWLICPTSTRFREGRACTGTCMKCHRVSVPKAWFSRLVDHAVAVSRFVMERHREQNFFRARDQSIIHNSIPSISVERMEFKTPRTPFRVGFIGRIDATKGIREFFTGVAKAMIVSPALEVHIAGRDYDGVLPALMHAYPGLKVVFHGFMDARKFYESVDLVAVTSMWDEPFGVVAIEPWEFYKPSVAFASGGLSELYADLTDLIVPRGDCAALGRLIGRLANDKDFYVDVALRCYAQRARFMRTEQARQFEGVFASVVAQRGGLKSASRRERDAHDA